MKATPVDSVRALMALLFGHKVRCTRWAEGRYIEVVADKIVLCEGVRQVDTDTTTQNAIIQDLVVVDSWEILDYEV